MNTNLCDTVGSNTGPIGCDPKRGRPVIIAYGGKIFSKEETSTPELFRAAFKAAMALPNGDADKIYPIPENVGTNDQTTAPKTATLGAYGPEITLIRGRGAYDFDLAVGVTLEKKLLALDGENAPFFIWDDKKNMWGTDNGEEGFVGYDCVISVVPKPFDDGKDARVTRFKISIISQTQMDGDGVYVPSKNFKGSDFKGLNDVTLKLLDVSDSGVKAGFRIGLEMPTSQFGRNLDLFPAQKLGALGSIPAWVASVAGVAIDVVAVSNVETEIDAVSAVPATRTVTITNKGTSTTDPTATYTITAIGSDADTINLVVASSSITGGTVAKTSSESTPTLLATKIKNAINTNTITTGVSATSAGAVITITAPIGDSAVITDVIVGGITGTKTNFAGKVNGDLITITANGSNLTAAPVEVTSNVTTPTLLATKVAAAINSYTGTSGYSATSAGAIVTITAPSSVGSSLNTTTTGISVTGTITQTNTAWTGGSYETPQVPAGKGFAVMLDPVAVADLDISSVIEITTVNTTALQALNVKGIEVINSVEYLTVA